MPIPVYCDINVVKHSQDQIFTAIMAKVTYLQKHHKGQQISKQQQQELKTLSWQMSQYSRIDYNQKTSVCNIILDYDKYEFRISRLKNNSFLIDNNKEDLIYQIVFKNLIKK
jgi:hypothetical protein